MTTSIHLHIYPPDALSLRRFIILPNIISDVNITIKKTLSDTIKDRNKNVIHYFMLLFQVLLAFDLQSMVF